MTDVVFSVTDGVGEIVLNRPKSLNSLQLAMLHAIEAQLIGWLDDDAVASIVLRGTGDRAYCAGADVRELRELVVADPNSAFDWLRDEYRLDSLIANYPKPMTCYQHGISMGGGLGIGSHGVFRVGDATTKWAMPEVGIGLWPDVGMLYHLSRCPGEIGTHLALTGATIDGASALYAGLLDEADDVDADASELARDRAWIDECYAGDDPAAIIAALEAHHDSRARETAALIRTRSPLSVCVTLEALRRAAGMANVDAVLAQDLVLAAHFVRNADFVEGVRAQLIDKDRNPSWRHARIEDVPRDEVLAMFEAREPERTEGWKAITGSAEAAYPDQTTPLHYATAVTYEEGGPDPLDGVSVYRATEPTPHWHYVGYGLTDIDDANVTSIDESGAELSGFGYELSFRVADEAAADPQGTPPPWPPALLQVIARHVVNSGEVFVPGSVVMSAGPLVQGVDTELTCLVFIADPDLEPVTTRSGEVRFVQAVGLTSDEAQAIGTVGVERFTDLFTRVHPKGITRLDRVSVLTDPTITDALGLTD